VPGQTYFAARATTPTWLHTSALVVLLVPAVLPHALVLLGSICAATFAFVFDFPPTVNHLASCRIRTNLVGMHARCDVLWHPSLSTGQRRIRHIHNECCSVNNDLGALMALLAPAFVTRKHANWAPHVGGFVDLLRQAGLGLISAVLRTAPVGLLVGRLVLTRFECQGVTQGHRQYRSLPVFFLSPSSPILEWG
jgi:hypothetical protein